MASREGVPNAELMPPDRSRCWDHAAQLGTVGIAASEIALAQHPERETQHSRHLQTSPDISGHLTMLMMLMKSVGHRIPALSGFGRIMVNFLVYCR